MSDLKAQGTKAFIWDFSGKMAMHGTGFIVTIFLARLLEPAEFGLVAMVMVIIGIAQIFTDVGLGSALIQRRRVLPVHYSSVFYFNILIGFLLTLITFLSASLIADFYNNDQLIPLAQVMSLAFIINAFSSVQATKLRKEINYAALTKANFIASLLSGIMGVFLALNGGGVWSLVAMTLSRGVIFNIYLWMVSEWFPALVFSFKALVQLWGFGFRMFLSGLLDTVFTRLDVMIIGKLFTPATLGFFERAKSLDQMVVTYSSGSLMSVLFPILSKVQKDLPRFQNIIIRSLGILSFVVFMLLGLMYLIGEELIIILFTEKWLPSVEYFKILILSGFAYPISALLVNVLSSRGNSKAFLRLEIYKKIVFGLNLLIGFVWGIEGYLYGLVLSSSLAVYLNIVFVSKEIHLPKLYFVKSLVIQAVLAIIVTVLVKYLNGALDMGVFINMLVKVFEYVFFYMLINKLLKTDAYGYFTDEAKPVFDRFLTRISK